MARSKWMICPICQGEGKHVNPNIDAKGLSREDFDRDPEFAESYRSGVYDVTCETCHESGKLLRSEWRARSRALSEAAEDRKLAAREDGDWEAYQVAGDWRYGA